METQTPPGKSPGAEKAVLGGGGELYLIVAGNTSIKEISNQ